MCLMINDGILKEGEGTDRITNDFVQMQSQDDASAELGSFGRDANECGTLL